MRFLNGGGCTLPVVANHAAELCQRMWHGRMRPEGLFADVAETCFLQSNVAGCAAIRHASLRNPYLPDAGVESALQAIRVRSGADQLPIQSLIMPPLTEEILGRGDGCDDG